MIPFVIIAVAMVTVALAWVLWPLLRPNTARSVEHATANVSIFKDQFADLDADLARGTISAEQHAESKNELQRRLLDEVQTATAESAPARGDRYRWSAVIVALLVPVAATALYWQIGTPAALSAATEPGAEKNQPTREQVEAMIAQIRQRLEKEPDNAEGWAILARTHYAMGNFLEAASAYAKLNALRVYDADVLADYADALAMSQGRNFAGQPMELVQRALTIDPTQWKALAMAGAEAFDRKDYKAAIDYWQRLQDTAAPDSPIAKQIQGSIDQARELAGTPAIAQAKKGDVAGSGNSDRSSSGTISGTVTLSPSLTSKVRPDDSVFVFARPADGSRMPVAVVRARVGELPLRFTLDDSRAMAPTARISGLQDVIVTARVSRSGNAIPASGDLQSSADKVKVGSQGIAVVIDRAIP